VRTRSPGATRRSTDRILSMRRNWYDDVRNSGQRLMLCTRSSCKTTRISSYAKSLNAPAGMPPMRRARPDVIAPGIHATAHRCHVWERLAPLATI
jgi:hypothetical protein